MTSSATNQDLGLRERKRLRTRASIVSEARRLTLEGGLSGFTVDHLCEQVGISRRTFFNYFPTKEDAVLGHSDDTGAEELLGAFVESGRAEQPVPLLEVLTALFADFGDRMAISREEYLTMSAVLQREPQLLAKLFARAEAKSQLLIDAIVDREALPADHPVPRVATFVLGGLARRSFDEFFAEGNTLTYAEVFRRNVEALRYLFPTPQNENQDPA